MTDLEEKLGAYEYDSAANPLSNVRPVNPENHPVFGSLLADFGYKKVYAADPAKLYAGSPIYKKQRTFRTERASAIARAKTSSGVIGWPGASLVFACHARPDRVAHSSHGSSAWSQSLCYC